MRSFLALGALGALTVLALAPAASAADVANGKSVFQAQCGACHKAGPDDGDGDVGPSLAGVIGRKQGGAAGFEYSQGLAASKTVWTQANLADFLADPQKAVPGTTMPVKVGSATDRTDVAAYLATVKAK
jgi:cytochrome c